ncbi:hypothetical protein GGF32_006557 [Allomyces javanicus]|nr:hypothetical protein GGF32_006557 [Allomyces javanicus]
MLTHSGATPPPSPSSALGPWVPDHYEVEMNLNRRVARSNPHSISVTVEQQPEAAPAAPMFAPFLAAGIVSGTLSGQHDRSLTALASVGESASLDETASPTRSLHAIRTPRPTCSLGKAEESIAKVGTLSVSQSIDEEQARYRLSADGSALARSVEEEQERLVEEEQE